MIAYDMTGKVTLVTGAGGGIGRGIAKVFAEAGSKVYVADLELDNAQQTVDEIRAKGGDAEALQIDLTDSAAIDKMIDGIEEKEGKLDNLITCAGIGYSKEYLDTTEEQLRLTLDINLIAVDNCCRAALRHMIPRKEGKIVNICSAASRAGHPYMHHYAASKFGVLGLTQSLALSVGEFNINVNGICPGIIATGFGQKQGGGVLDLLSEKTGASLEVLFKSVINDLPLKRLQEPEDIGYTALFLCSDFAKNITGQAINVDGGFRLN